MEHDRRTQETYERIAARYVERNSDRAMVRPWMSAFAARAGSAARVVDLGAGPCLDSGELRALGLRVISVDRSWSMLTVVRESTPGARVQADIRRLPFPGGSLGGVWANASLLHLDRADFAPALAGIRRVLRPAGVLFLSLKLGSGEGWDTTRDGPDLPRWFTYWSGAEIDAALRTAGFDVLESATVPKPPNTWIMRLSWAVRVP